jgi:hypothetical protein
VYLPFTILKNNYSVNIRVIFPEIKEKNVKLILNSVFDHEENKSLKIYKTINI